MFQKTREFNRTIQTSLSNPTVLIGLALIFMFILSALLIVGNFSDEFIRVLEEITNA